MSENKKLERDIESTTVSKLIVICVDRDDDVGRKQPNTILKPHIKLRRVDSGR